MGLLFIILTFALAFQACSAKNVSTYNFLSRPDIKAPTMKILMHNQETTSPGYILLTPNSPTETNFTAGPMMYDSYGNLVWFGSHAVKEGFKAYNFQPCGYQGLQHLCWTMFRGPRFGGPGGLGSSTHILNSSYDVVQNVKPSGQYQGHDLTQDLHEFNMKGATGATAIIVSYVIIPLNVTYPGCDIANTTYTKTGVFSEVKTDGSDTELFSWAAIDYVDPHDTYICPGHKQAGDGQTDASGFDFFHINAVDKDEQGDYVVSGRHTSTIYKVAGLNNTSHKPGEIIWHLGGKSNTFQNMLSEVPGAPNLNFSFQHHVRYEPSIQGISLWDNAHNNGPNTTALASSGKSIRISPDLTSATLVSEFVSPGRQLDASQGSHQVLPNGSHFLGLGNDPEVYEYTSSGSVSWYAQFGEFPIASYRAFKTPWTGEPQHSEMALFTYARSCDASTMAFYASWNGATEIKSWRFYTSESRNGIFMLRAMVQTDGSFETVATGQKGTWAYAGAYDAAGNELGWTSVARTFVPQSRLVGERCGEWACEANFDYAAAPTAPCTP